MLDGEEIRANATPHGGGTWSPYGQDGPDEGRSPSIELALQIEAFGAIVRKALTRPLTREEQVAITELVESLRELVGDDVEL
jgi:hypothetical protein